MDDRQAFEIQKLHLAAQLAQDGIIQEKNKELHILADRRHFSYLWSWLGVPIIQCPTDIVTMQEIIWKQRPDVIIETGVARGGSLILYASILALIGRGRVIGIDIDIRTHNRLSIESSIVSKHICLIEGSSIDPTLFSSVDQMIQKDEKVMVVLDSNHAEQHVFEELMLYAPLVTSGQYLVVADTSIEYLSPEVRTNRPWSQTNHPKSAITRYLAQTDRFVLDPFINQRLLLSSSPNGYYKACS